MATLSPSNRTPHTIEVKIIVCGNSFAGKSCLVSRWTTGGLPSPIQGTIGIDYAVKTITIGKEIVRVTVWDTAGQERFRSLAQSYWRGAHGIALVYSCADRDSFHGIKEWLHEMNRSEASQVPRILISNKNDLSSRETKVSIEEGEKLSRETRSTFFSTSALTGDNVATAFETLVELILKNGGGKRKNTSSSSSSSTSEQDDASSSIDGFGSNGCC
jgi:small GTP-binding protein